MPVDEQLFVAFLVTTLVAMVVPGPDMLFVLGCGVRGGARAGLLATAGVATSEVVHVVLAAAGLVALFAAVPAAFAVTRVVGGAYLVFLGVQMIRKRGQGMEVDGSGGVSGRRAYSMGLLTNLVNPKMVTFTLAFLPQFVDPARGQLWLQFAVLGAALVVIEFVVDGSVGVAAGRIGGWLRTRERVRRRLDVTTGGLFIGLGSRLALER
ncbi:LysE family translocator [Kribbella sandramycini]|uniref:LysE family translocator n=1 Tax=Kribbella sandramycini TaxID=60450 RepID=A0A7Y4L5Y7_9ACTN|nr:LysE family translocator [Kribbella sandramycini]MBB6565959.1 threonine/homoserine/homoserine lactone efflux protein [Kribbella sandramycini]NOL44962.1 LysE family translocator [Kribbella sandramycini]